MSQKEKCILVVGMSFEEVTILKLLTEHKIMTFLQLVVLSDLSAGGVREKEKKTQEIINCFSKLGLVMVFDHDNPLQEVIILKEEAMDLVQWIPARDLLAIKEVKAPLQ